MKLKTSYEELDAQAEGLLLSVGLEPDELHKRLFAMYVQQQLDTDEIDAHYMGSWVRKQLVNEAAFYIIRPDAYKKMLEDKAKAEEKVDEHKE
jgi:hypothetical protein